MNNLTEQMEQDQTEVIKSTTNIKTLSDQVLKLRAMEDQLKIMEDALKTKKKEIDRVSGEVIPTMLSEMGLSQLKLADGSSVDVKPFYSATISAQNKDKAYSWLRTNGLGDIIKNDISVSFGRNEDDKAAKYADLAKSNGFQPTQKLKVEPMTLKALVRERIEAGKEMPTEIFNIFVGNKTTIKRKQ
ncbi:MAG: hypothetical protein H8E55_03260 [Pelagibacterales bacterium]|nr:hypothetical protein [Pelagibacterales bacterium]